MKIATGHSRVKPIYKFQEDKGTIASAVTQKCDKQESILGLRRTFLATQIQTLALLSVSRTSDALQQCHASKKGIGTILARILNLRV
jgi:hypothetical protein